MLQRRRRKMWRNNYGSDNRAVITVASTSRRAARWERWAQAVLGGRIRWRRQLRHSPRAALPITSKFDFAVALIPNGIRVADRGRARVGLVLACPHVHEGSYRGWRCCRSVAGSPVVRAAHVEPHLHERFLRVAGCPGAQSVHDAVDGEEAHAEHALELWRDAEQPLGASSPTRRASSAATLPPCARWRSRSDRRAHVPSFSFSLSLTYTRAPVSSPSVCAGPMSHRVRSRSSAA